MACGKSGTEDRYVIQSIFCVCLREKIRRPGVLFIVLGLRSRF